MPDVQEGLQAAVAEIEEHVHTSGWDRGPTLFAIVSAGQFTVDEPETAARLGIDTQPAEALTPIEQDGLPDDPLDEVLARLTWPASVLGCAVTQEIVILPPSAEADVTAHGKDDAVAAAQHPDRREARLVVGVLRGGTSASMLRLRPVGAAGEEDERLIGPDLAPNLVEALLTTLA